MSTTAAPAPYPPHAPPVASDLTERLRDPATRAAVDGLLDRVERLNRAIDARSRCGAWSGHAVSLPRPS